MHNFISLNHHFGAREEEDNDSTTGLLIRDQDHDDDQLDQSNQIKTNPGAPSSSAAAATADSATGGLPGGADSNPAAGDINMANQFHNLLNQTPAVNKRKKMFSYRQLSA